MIPICDYQGLSINHRHNTQSSTLSLHDALPIYNVEVGEPPRARRIEAAASPPVVHRADARPIETPRPAPPIDAPLGDRKSTRLNSSHLVISYAVFCLKKKKKTTYIK